MTPKPDLTSKESVEDPATSKPVETSPQEQAAEDSVGEFIANHVLDKDTVFFEG